MYNNNKRDRKQNIIMIIVVFSTMTGMIIMDFVSKLRNANSFKRKLEADGKSEFKLQQTKNLQTTDQFEFFFCRQTIDQFGFISNLSLPLSNSSYVLSSK